MSRLPPKPNTRPAPRGTSLPSYQPQSPSSAASPSHRARPVLAQPVLAQPSPPAQHVEHRDTVLSIDSNSPAPASSQSTVARTGFPAVAAISDSAAEQAIASFLRAFRSAAQQDAPPLLAPVLSSAPSQTIPAATSASSTSPAVLRHENSAVDERESLLQSDSVSIPIADSNNAVVAAAPSAVDAAPAPLAAPEPAPSWTTAAALDPQTLARQAARLTPFLLLLLISALMSHAFGWFTIVLLSTGLNRVQSIIDAESLKGEGRDKKPLLLAAVMIMFNLLFLMLIFSSYECFPVFAFHVPAHADIATAAALKSTANSPFVSQAVSETLASGGGAVVTSAPLTHAQAHARYMNLADDTKTSFAKSAAVAVTKDHHFYHDGMSFWACVWVSIMSGLIVRFLSQAIDVGLLFVQPKRIKKLMPASRAVFSFYRQLLPIAVWSAYFAGSHALHSIALIFVVAYWMSKATLMSQAFSSTVRVVKAAIRDEPVFGKYATEADVAACGNSCSICYNEFSSPLQLHCKHVFCESCIVQWLDQEKTCPLCRAAIPYSQARLNSVSHAFLLVEIF